MREFFKQELKTLYAKTQFQQYQTLSAMPDAQDQLKVLLDTLVEVCDRYSYISNESKQRIIRERMMTDKDFKGFNGPILTKWMEEAKGIYYKEEHHMKSDDIYKPIDRSPEEQSRIDAIASKYLAELADIPGIKSVPQVTRQEIKAVELSDSVASGQSKSVGRPSVSVTQRQLLLKAINRLGLDKCRLEELKDFDVSGYKIKARTLEEAENIWAEVYA